MKEKQLLIKYLLSIEWIHILKSSNSKKICNKLTERNNKNVKNKCKDGFKILKSLKKKSSFDFLKL